MYRFGLNWDPLRGSGVHILEIRRRRFSRKALFGSYIFPNRVGHVDIVVCLLWDWSQAVYIYHFCSWRTLDILKIQYTLTPSCY